MDVQGVEWEKEEVTGEGIGESEMEEQVREKAVRVKGSDRWLVENRWRDKNQVLWGVWYEGWMAVKTGV